MQHATRDVQPQLDPRQADAALMSSMRCKDRIITSSEVPRSEV